MIVGVISDTHDRIISLEQVFEIFNNRQVEVVVHCGDWTRPDTLRAVATAAHNLQLPLYGVLGNNDLDKGLIEANMALDNPVIFSRDDPQLLEVVLGGKRLIAYHGHHKPTLRKLMVLDGYDVLLTGHTHKPLIEPQGAKLIINPGSTAFSIPRRREPRTIAVYDTNQGTAEIIDYEPL